MEIKGIKNIQMEHPLDNISKGCCFLRKIKFLLPMILLVIILFVGVVNINIMNTQAMNQRKESLQGTDIEKIKEEFGDEFSEFIVDKSSFKIHSKNKDYILEFNGADYQVTSAVNVVKKVTNFFWVLYGKVLSLFS